MEAVELRMKIAYFDCFAGISGDMFVGALIDLGLDLEALRAELGKLPLDGFRLEAERVDKRGIQAMQFRVMLDAPEGEQLADSGYEEVTQPGESRTSADTGHAQRTLPEIIALIEASRLSPWVKSTASAIFTRLAQAEGRVHGLPPEQVHFHEVGAVDAIVDVVSAAIGLEQLGIQAVYASPLHLGSGFVRSAHGVYPVPGPATAELLVGVPVYTSTAQGELVTPTGAAILTTLARGFGLLPLMHIEAVGYGAGSREREFPNAVRLFLGKGQVGGEPGARPVRDPFPQQHAASPGPAGYHEGPAVVIEANLDDMNPELYENLSERLLDAGALDVLLIPVHMKKGRPGMLLHVLAYPPSVDALLEVIFAESTSIGARTYPVTKRMLQREVLPVATPYGVLGVKVARLGGRVVNLSPEYEDCRQAARRLGVPLKEVFAAALSAARQSLAEG
jgi:hypothetical protein